MSIDAKAMEEYMADNYGKCDLEKCKCLLTRTWKGRMCEHWHPLDFKSIEDMSNDFVRKGKTHNGD